jgi:hypothetical protein
MVTLRRVLPVQQGHSVPEGLRYVQTALLVNLAVLPDHPTVHLAP